MNEITTEVKQFIMDEFLPGEDPAELTTSTPLVSGGILDSIALTRLTLFLEERFNVVLKPHEVTSEYLDTLDRITQLVQTKRGEQQTA